MASVNKIDEYRRKSSTESINAQYGVPPKNVIINATTANAIQKDFEQGNVELSSGQERYLDSQVDYDNIEYTDEERNNIGKNQLDTDFKDKNSVLGSTANAVGSAAGSAAVVGVAKVESGNVIQNSIDDAVKRGTKQGTPPAEGNPPAEGTPPAEGEAPSGGDTGAEGQGADGAKLSEEKAEKSSKIPFAALIAGAVSLAGGVMGLMAANTFDEQFNARISQLNSSEDTNSIIQQYTDVMSSDMDAMGEESITYTELLEQQTQADIDMIAEIGMLQAQIAVYQAQGNSEKVAELTEKINQLKEEGESGSLNEDIDGIRENLETYTANAAEADGLKTSGDSVAEFLGDGKQMGILGTVQTALLTVAALLAVKGSINAIKAAAKAPTLLKAFAAACAIAGAAMMLAGNAMLIVAAGKMLGKTKDEFDCASAGGKMEENLATLGENIESQQSYTDTAEGNYTEEATKAAEATSKTQEGVDNANKNLPKPAPAPTSAAGNGGDTNLLDEPEPAVA